MSLMPSTLGSLPLVVVLGLTAAPWARAQSAESPTSPEAQASEDEQDADAQLEPAADGAVRATEEVLVTARRVEERLEDTPIAISAFSARDLEERQTVSTHQLDQVTPNLQFTSNTTLAGNNASSAVFIRGIGQTDPTSSVDPGVGLYIDDVYMGQSIGGSLEFRDIRSVQVLRGPQGTLFGRNTVGGAVLLTTYDPGDQLGGSLRAEYGSDELRDGFIALNAPLSPTFKTRFTLGVRKQDGYVIRAQTGEDLGDADTLTGTAKLLWEPNSRFKARAQFDYTRNRENGNPFVFAAMEESATFPRVASADAGCPGVVFPVSGPVPALDDDRCGNDLQAAGPYSNNGTYPLQSDLDGWGGALVMTLTPNEKLTFKSITSYRSLDWVGVRDADNTPLTILHTSYDSQGDQFSQELQAQYNSGRVRGTVGVYYMDEETTDIVYVQLNDPAPGVQEDSDNNISQNTNWAAFSQWTFDASSRLSLTLGGRYTQDTKGSIPDQFNYANPGNKYLPVRLYEQSFDAFTFSGTVSSRWNPSLMTYLSYSEGFKGGGWNSHFNTCQILDPCANGLGGPPLANAQAAAAVFPLVHSFGPEEATTWELGFKATLWDRRLRLNAAAFTTDYTDLQFTYRSGVAPYLANAGKAGISGFETELTLLASGWLVNAGVGFLDSSVDELRTIAGTGIGVEVGNVLPFSPEFQGNVGIGYRGHLGESYTLSPRVDLAHQSQTFFDANNTVEIAQLDPYTILNASVTFAPSDEKWRLTLGGSNLTDEVYATGGNSSLTTGSGYSEIAYARPREFFVRLSLRF